MTDFLTTYKKMYPDANAVLSTGVSLKQRGELGYIDDWNSLSSPEVWELVEVYGRYEAWFDTAWGKIALFDKVTQELSLGKNMTTLCNGCVTAFNTSYYGTPSYIYLNAKAFMAEAIEALPDDLKPYTALPA